MINEQEHRVEEKEQLGPALMEKGRNEDVDMDETLKMFEFGSWEATTKARYSDEAG